jgi:hypothetical protein
MHPTSPPIIDFGRRARLATCATGIAAIVAGTANAGFVGLVVDKTQTSNAGINLDVYTLWARFDGPTDTVLNAYNFNRVDSDVTNIFYHKDTESYNGGILSKAYGAWAPQMTGSATLNRPFDSYLTIGGLPTATNTSQNDPSWVVASAAGWIRPDVPDNFNVGWYNPTLANLQGRVGAAGNTATDVRLGQFVVDRNAFGGTWSLTIGYNNGVPPSAAQFADSTFALPAPGAIALLGIAGLTVGHRRRSG